MTEWSHLRDAQESSSAPSVPTSTPMLATDNAIALYERLGYRHRTDLNVAL